MINITITKRQADSLKELMKRGLAYTDMYYSCSKRMENICNTVIEQIKNVNNTK
jgi:hypothetical protein